MMVNYWIQVHVEKYEFKDKNYCFFFIVSEIICMVLLYREFSRVDASDMLSGSKMVYTLTAIFKIMVILFTVIRLHKITKRTRIDKQERLKDYEMK